MATWTEDALELWQDMVDEWGDEVTFANFGPYDCIKNPIRSAFRMTQVAYTKEADTTIDMLRTDAVTCGLYLLNQNTPATARPVVTVDGHQFEILGMENDDTAQPSVRFNCRILQ